MSTATRIDEIATAAGFTRLSLTASLLIVVAGVLTFLAAQQARSLTTKVRAASEPAQAEARARVAKRYFNARDYERAVPVLQRNHPDVVFEVSRGGTQLRVAVKNPARYDAWVYALNSLQGFGRDVGWEADTMCLGKCSDGDAAQAVVRGFTQELQSR